MSCVRETLLLGFDFTERASMTTLDTMAINAMWWGLTAEGTPQLVLACRHLRHPQLVSTGRSTLWLGALSRTERVIHDRIYYHIIYTRYAHTHAHTQVYIYYMYIIYMVYNIRVLMYIRIMFMYTLYVRAPLFQM